MKYQGTEIDVNLGDRVIYKHLLWGKSKGVVAYLPGASEANPDIEFNGTQQWLLKLENGKCVFMLFTPQLEFAHPRVKFVERGDAGDAIKPTDPIH